MKAVIDVDMCTGCELCVATAPDVFEMVDDVAVMKGDAIADEHAESAKQAAEECPVEAIVIE
jgi:ferredoxin